MCRVRIQSHNRIPKRTHSFQENFDKAIAEYQRILTANPRYPRAHYHLGLAYQGKGMRAAAQKAFQEFLSVWSGADPDVPEIIDAKARLSLKTN